MKILKYQLWHFLILLIMLLLLFSYIEYDNNVLDGEFLNIRTKSWLIVSVLIPIIHQIYVLICWRTELYYKGLSKVFGTIDNAFKVYKIGFAVLILSRLLSIIILAFSNKDTLYFNSNIINATIIIIALPTIYLFYSVRKYFGFDRAFGLDHFEPDKIKKIPFVKKGIFKYTSNGMYIYGFLILWIPGLILMSKAALLIAGFNHLYIWVHYYFTELPDIMTNYKDKYGRPYI